MKSFDGQKDGPTISALVCLECNGVPLKAEKVTWGFIMRTSNSKKSIYTEHAIKKYLHWSTLNRNISVSLCLENQFLYLYTGWLELENVWE